VTASGTLFLVSDWDSSVTLCWLNRGSVVHPLSCGKIGPKQYFVPLAANSDSEKFVFDQAPQNQFVSRGSRQSCQCVQDPKWSSLDRLTRRIESSILPKCPRLSCIRNCDTRRSVPLCSLYEWPNVIVSGCSFGPFWCGSYRKVFMSRFSVAPVHTFLDQRGVGVPSLPVALGLWLDDSLTQQVMLGYCFRLISLGENIPTGQAQ
jgi:hypothetical protein